MSRSMATIAVGIAAALLAASGAARADDGGHGSPAYQRGATSWSSHHGSGFRHGPPRHQAAWTPPVSAGWFQRPYPYHLDFYRMRYGGSYAPYFGNLYGPPQVVTAPPYFGPYYGGYVDPAAGYGAPWGGYAQPPIGHVEPFGGPVGPPPAGGQTGGEAAGNLPAPGSSAVGAPPVD